jgi:hypothetical protein
LIDYKINRKEAFQEIEKYIDSKNVMRNTILPAMVEIAVTAVVKRGIISKLLEKIKRG